jgi:hypothetical protein
MLMPMPSKPVCIQYKRRRRAELYELHYCTSPHCLCLVCMALAANHTDLPATDCHGFIEHASASFFD